MSKGRHVLTEEETAILESTKNEITTTIKTLMGNGVRDVNIALELTTHIKKIVKEEGEDW